MPGNAPGPSGRRRIRAHNKVYPDLPGNLYTVAADNPGVRMRLYDRDDSVNAVFDNRRDMGVLSEEFRTMRDARLQSPATTQQMRKEAQEQADWHRALPDNPRSTPALLREHLQFDKPAISTRDSDAWSTLDALVRPGAQPTRAPVPEPADPYPRLRGFKAASPSKPPSPPTNGTRRASARRCSMAPQTTRLRRLMRSCLTV